LPLLLLSLYAALAEQTQPSSVAATKRKLRHIGRNATLPNPDPEPTEFSEQEINSYFASDEVELPAGVQSVSFTEEAGTVTGRARVDFDRIEAGRTSSNPLLAVFSGVHDVVVLAHAHGVGGEGFVEADSVLLDGVEIPRFVLQLFVQKYVQPKYPNLGLNSRFALPDRVDTAVIGSHKVTLTQK